MKWISSLVWAPVLVSSTVLLACPFCGGPPTQTWSELLAEADTVVFAEVVSVTRDKKTARPTATVRVLEIHKGGEHLSNTQQLTVVDVDGEPGTRFILHATLRRSQTQPASQSTFTDANGDKDDVQSSEPAYDIRPVSASGADVNPVESNSARLVWDLNQQLNRATWEYITGAPAADAPSIERLRYFVKFLESAEPEIAIDAWSEFANAQYEEVKAVRDSLDRTKLRQWIANEQTEPQRLGLYGMLLGLCGTADDAAFLRQQIGMPSPDRISFGTDGLMGGLLLLTAKEGLAFISETRLENPQATYADINPAVGALNFIWSYEPELIEKDLLRRSLHPLLERPGIGELILKDLARWEDWSAVTKLPQIYEICKAKSDDYTIRQITGYLEVLIESEAGQDAQLLTAAKALMSTIQAEYPRINRPFARYPR